MTISDFAGGGAEREFAGLVGAMSEAEFDIHLLIWRPVFAYSIPPVLPVHVVKKDRAWHVVTAIPQIRRLIRDLRPDVVFSQLHYVNIVTGTALAGLNPRPRWIARFVNDPQREMRGLLRAWARWALSRCDLILGASEGVATALASHLGFDEAKTAVVDNVVDVHQIERLSKAPLPIGRDEGSFVVVHAGRFTRQKNQRMLLQAFSELTSERARLWMLGQGELEEDLKRLAGRLGIADRVSWLGFQENPYPFFQAADVFALSSDHEGMPNVLIESMLCGTPVVATDCRFGPAELIDSASSGFLVPVGNYKELGAALGLLERDPSLTALMGENARSQAQHRFETSRVVSEYQRIFKSLSRVSR
jgi:glycosyltransferase involved in cell wall biosynthesis